MLLLWLPFLGHCAGHESHGDCIGNCENCEHHGDHDEGGGCECSGHQHDFGFTKQTVTANPPIQFVTGGGLGFVEALKWPSAPGGLLLTLKGRPPDSPPLFLMAIRRAQPVRGPSL